MCNNTCPIYDYQKCIDEDICIKIKDQHGRIFSGLEIKNNPLKYCLAEKYNLGHLNYKRLKVENNIIKPNEER